MGKEARRVKIKGLRKRWIINTLCVVCVLGLLCVVLVTAAFADHYYSTMKSDLHYRAKNATGFFAEYQNQNYNEFYQSCITYARTFADKNNIELQFINRNGSVVVSSYDNWTSVSPTTPEIQQAIETRGVRTFVGKDPHTNEKIMAVSSPMIYSNGEVIGVLRYVTSTRIMDMQIFWIAISGLFALLVILAIIFISSNFYMRTILVPLGQIIEKAKRIASGSYGIQIQTENDDEIGELASTINDLSLQIGRNEKMQTDFISSLSHELRTPLTAITGWSETLLSSEDLDENDRRGLSIIMREAKRLTGMVEELLDFTRIQDGRITLNVEPVDIRAEFEDAVYMYGNRLAQEGIKLDYLDTDMDAVEITCDPKRLRQVFLNILDNAAKHGGDGKRIDTSLQTEADEVVVRIRDYGPGIPEDELPLVKHKFYKGSSKARGSGIGLAVCDEIVQLHGGTLTLANAIGGGTEVTVRLPISQ